MSDEYVKIHTSAGDAAAVGAQLLAAADSPSDVKVSKVGGFGFVVPKYVAEAVGWRSAGKRRGRPKGSSNKPKDSMGVSTGDELKGDDDGS